MNWGLALSCVLWALLAARPAAAADQAELIKEAQAAEEAFLPARAEALYREALAVDPGSRLARRAKARIEWLTARSEDGYRPLAALMRMRAEPAREVARVERFAAEVEGFPAGPVRRESLALIADSYLRLGDAERAVRAYEAWLASDGINEAERRLANAGAAVARAKLGRLAESEEGLERAGLGDRPEAVFVRAERIARAGTVIAAALIGLFVALGMVWGGWRGFRPTLLKQAFAPRRLLLGLFVLGLPLALLQLYDHHIVPLYAPVLLWCALPLALAAIVGQAAPRRPHLVAVLGAAATLGVGFTVVAQSRLLFDIMMAWEQAP